MGDDDDGWIFYGQGAMHDLDSRETEPRLWFAKSVSPAAAKALAKRPEPTRPQMGFRFNARKP